MLYVFYTDLVFKKLLAPLSFNRTQEKPPKCPISIRHFFDHFWVNTTKLLKIRFSELFDCGRLINVFFIRLVRCESKLEIHQLALGAVNVVKGYDA